jgi:dihydrofolate reductase
VRPIWHCHIAVSLDGHIARPDGSVDWLAEYPAEAFGFEDFLAGVDAILMGRATYEAVRRLGAWPHPGKPTVVVTSRALPDPPDRVEARGGELGTIVAELEQRGLRRIWIEGGGQLLRGMLAISRLDVLEIAVIPIVLGNGIPLFPAGAPETKLRLARCEAKPRGALHVVYQRAA